MSAEDQVTLIQPMLAPMGLLDRWRQRRADRDVAWATNRAHQTSMSEWSIALSLLTAEQRRLLDVKWRLSEVGWSPGDNPPRPLSAEDVAARLANTPQEVRRVDDAMMETMVPHVMATTYRKMFMPWLMARIDEGQQWWARRYGDQLNPDGSFKRPES
jgi:hypothetical protein